MILLIDGDVLLYRFGFRGQFSVDWDNDGDEHIWIYPELTVYEMMKFINDLKIRAGCKSVRVCLSGSSSEIFRYKILSTYKHNRWDAEKPEMFWFLKDILCKQTEVIQKPCLEADDCMGIMSTKRPDKCVIASIDKDLQQIPGWYLNWDKHTEPQYIRQEDADRWFYEQILSGDSTDGYSGVPNIGPKCANRIINSVYADVANPTKADIWERIVMEYNKKGLSEDYALMMARMARILRAEDWDEENQEPIYWLPEGDMYMSRRLLTSL
jgi:DNA polymerase-1